MTRTILPLCLGLSVAVLAQDRVVFEQQPAVRLSNDKLAMTVFPEGGAMAEITLSDDAGHVNPMWNPTRIARDAGLKPSTDFSRGHFVCVDGFGPASAEERAAGYPMHGEAHLLQSFIEFSCPMAPTRDGQRFDLRSASLTPYALKYSTSLPVPARRLVFHTALHLEKKLLIGWVYRRAEVPWIQTQLSYAASNR